MNTSLRVFALSAWSFKMCGTWVYSTDVKSAAGFNTHTHTHTHTKDKILRCTNTQTQKKKKKNRRKKRTTLFFSEQSWRIDVETAKTLKRMASDGEILLSRKKRGWWCWESCEERKKRERRRETWGACSSFNKTNCCFNFFFKLSLTNFFYSVWLLKSTFTFQMITVSSLHTLIF